MSGREKKWTVYNINNESFDKCECSVLFCSNILLLSMSNSNREKFKKHNFGKKVLHETKKVNSLRFVSRDPLHNRGGKRSEYFVGF